MADESTPSPSAPPPPTTDTLATAEWFYYTDATGTVQGPFATSCMAAWHEQGYLPPETEVSPSFYGEVPQIFWPIGTLWPNSASAFFSSYTTPSPANATSIGPMRSSGGSSSGAGSSGGRPTPYDRSTCGGGKGGGSKGGGVKGKGGKDDGGGKGGGKGGTGGTGDGPAPPRDAATTKRHQAAWREHTGPGLDMALLKRREEILFSAEVPLYEDHLHDHGISSLTARIRVMPSCFLVLLRHTLRIDGVLIMQRESRVFHKFGENVVIRSHRKAQKDLPPLPSSATLRANPPRAIADAIRAPPAHALPSTTARVPPETTARMPPPTTTRMPLENTTRMPMEATTRMPMEATTRMPLEATTRMPLETTTRMPLETTTRMPLETTTRMPLETTTRMPPQTTRMPVPGAVPSGLPGGRMGLHPMAMRMPLDEQGISEILQAEPAQESTEEILISSDEISPSESAAVVGEASSAVEQPTNGAAPLVKAAASADAAPARECVGCQMLEPAVLPLEPFDASLSVLSVAADGSMLVGGDCEGTLLLCQLQHDKARRDGDAAMLCSELWRVTAAHRGAVLGAVVTPSKRWVLSCGEDGSCAVWRAAGGVVRTAPSRRWTIDCKSADRVVHSYVEQPKEEGGASVRVRKSLAVVQCLAVEPEEEASGFAVAAGSSVFLLDRTESQPALRLPAGRAVTSLAYIGARRCLCASGYGGVRIWAQYGRGGEALLEYKGPLDTLAISPDVRYAASGAQDSTLVLWPLGGKEESSQGVADVTDARADGPTVSLSQANSVDAASAAAVAAAAPPPPPPPPPAAPPADASLAKLGPVSASQQQDLTPRSEAEAALHAGSALFFGGCYDQKVGPLDWDAEGRLCASAGGRHVVVWDMGAMGTPPPVRQNGRALLLLGHRAVVRWLAFEPTHDDDAPRATSDASAGARRLIASIGSDGRVMLHQVPLPSGEDGEEGEEEDQIDGGRARVQGEQPIFTAARRHAGSVRRHARTVREPVGATGGGVAARDGPAVWAPGGWVIFSTRRGELAVVRAPDRAARDSAEPLGDLADDEDLSAELLGSVRLDGQCAHEKTRLQEQPILS